MDDQRIKIAKDGPYLVYGGLPLNIEAIGANDEGGSWTWELDRALDAPQNVCVVPMRPLLE